MSRVLHDACRVLRFEFESASQLRMTKAFVLLALLVGIGGFIVLLTISRSIVVRFRLVLPTQREIVEVFIHTLDSPASWPTQAPTTRLNP